MDIIKSDQNIVFDESTHVYTRNNIPYTSVTTLLKKYNLSPSYNNIPQAVLTNAAARGTYVHSVLETYIKTGAVLDSIILQPFIMYTTNRKIDLSKAISEEKVYNDKYQIAGTIDFQYVDGNDIIIADFKTTSQVHWESVTWQISIYTYLKYGGDVLEYYTKRGQVFHMYQGGFEVSELPLIPIEEVEKLLQANLTNAPYTYVPDVSNIISKTELTVYQQLRTELNMYNFEVKKLERMIDQMDTHIINNMNSQNIRQFKTNGLVFKLSIKSGSKNLDVAKVKAYFAQNGIPIDQFIKTGKGKTSLIYNDTTSTNTTSLASDIAELAGDDVDNNKVIINGSDEDTNEDLDE